MGKSPLTFEIPKGLNVVTNGAHILVDISNSINGNDLLEARENAALKYPEGCVNAEMITEDNKVFVFINQGVLWSKGKTHLSLSGANEITTDLVFTKVIMKSCHAIKGSQIVWVNYKY